MNRTHHSLLWRPLYRPLLSSLACAYYLANRRDEGLVGKGAWRVWRERLMLPFGPVRRASALWLHVSGPGDAKAAEAFLGHLWAFLPDLDVCITYGALSARNVIEKSLRRVSRRHQSGWLPLDARFAVRRFLHQVRPAAFVNMQGEMWPVLVRELHAAGIPSIALRVDMFDWDVQDEFPKWIRPLYKQMISYVDLFSVRQGMHTDNLKALGVPAERIRLGGDYRPEALPKANDAKVAQYRELFGVRDGQPLVILAGPRPDEVEGMASFLQDGLATSSAVYVVAPVEQDALHKAEEALSARGGNVVRRSMLSSSSGPHGAILLDTHGELFDMYAAADVVVLGDTFPPTFGEGRNFWEGLRQGAVVVHGPGLPESEHVRALTEEGLLREIQDYECLPTELERALTERPPRRVVQETVQNISQTMPGASERDARMVLDYLSWLR